MLKIVTPSNPDGFLVKDPKLNATIFSKIPVHEHSKAKLRWIMVPYLRASIRGNAWVYTDKTIRKVVLRAKKQLKNLDATCYAKISKIPSSVRFPFKGSLSTGLTFTNLLAKDQTEVGGHRDKKDEDGTSGFSYRVNTQPGDRKRATGAETTHTRAARAREVHVHCTRCTMYGYRSRARYICVLTATERHCCSLVVIALAVIALAVLGIDVITLLLFSNSCVI